MILEGDGIKCEKCRHILWPTQVSTTDRHKTLDRQMLDALKCIFLERNLATFQVPGEEYTWTLVDRQSHIYKCTLVRHKTKQQTKARHWARVKMYHASHRQDPGTLLSSLGGRGRIILGWDLDFDRIMGGQRQTLSRQTHGCNFLKDSSVFVCLFVAFVCV